MATDQLFWAMKAYFESGATRSYNFRCAMLLRLKEAVKAYETQILEALQADLHKSAEEAYSTEIGFFYSEISFALKHLNRWMQKTTVSTPLFLFPSKSYIVSEPMGVCLVIAPWNYPFQLLFAPLLAAIAGGNCVLLKPSEVAANTSAVVATMVAEFFDPAFVAVVEGDGQQVVTDLMQRFRFDHVFFTGSVNVGRSIAVMAAEKLVPVTLELGGKSPCIVDEDANMAVAANRITWGKFTNAGQTCVAPDYLLVHEKSKDVLLNEMAKSIEHFFGNALVSADYGRLISQQRFDIVSNFLQHGNILLGGQTDANQLFIAPTLIEVLADSPAMQQEIFGPVLPVFTFANRKQAADIIQQYPNPLALYYFGANPQNQQYFTEGLAFGGGCINNTLVHLANPNLPFGGVGNSGNGMYHGKFGFDTFTRQKSIVKTSTRFDPAVKYPPYGGKLKFLKWLFR